MFGTRLKKLREENGISQRELAKIIQLSPSTVAMYELDQRSPDKDTLVKLANMFICTTDYLLGISDIRNSWTPNLPNEVNRTKLPIIGTIRAGLPILANENIEGYLEVPDYLRANYVLQVKGDSMLGAGILDGDLAICRETNVPQSGQIIVALRDEGSLSEATLKFYMNGNVHPCLRAANPVFADIDYKDGYRTAGTMVALVRKEAPGYQVYKNYISVPGYDEWAEVLELATSTGIKPERMKSLIEMINEVGKGK